MSNSSKMFYDDAQKAANNTKKLIYIILGLLSALVIISILIFLLIQAYNKSQFKASPSGFLINERIPSNPLSRIVYPFVQPVHWSQLPTGATQLTTIQGDGRMAF